MKSACACLVALPVAASSGRFGEVDSNLVLLQRHAEAKFTASGGTDEQIWPFDQLYGEIQKKIFGETQKPFDQLLGGHGTSSEVEASTVGTEAELSTDESPTQDEWRFCGTEVSNNLGGLGPDFGAAREIRYKRVLKLVRTGQELDLVVTNTTEYSANDILKNGEDACFGRINIKSPGSLTMQFKLVATGTDDFVDDLDHDFTVMDLDHSKAGMMESITTSGFTGTPISVITPELAADGSYTFEGLDSSKAITDPRSPWNLTQPQKDASVGFKFSARNSWEVTYNTWDDTGLLSGGRNFLFTGKTTLQDPKPCGQGTMDTETGECVVYQDPHIDGFDNPRNGPFLTRISAWDMPKSHTSLLSKGVLKSWSRDDPPSIDVNEYERGDFWLVKNAQLSIQGRYDTSEEFPGGRSGLAALAVGGPMLDGGIVTLEPKRGAITFFGKSVEDVADQKHETTTGLVAIKSSYDGVNEDGEEATVELVELTLPLGVLVHVRRYNTHLDAKIMVPRQLGNIDGQCGNWNGDATDDSLDAISERMGSTKVLESELLFAKPLVELSTEESPEKDEWNFCDADVSNNNLGGMGPDSGVPAEVRYKRVLKLPTGQELDLVVTNTTEYSPHDVLKNGEDGCFGRINIKSPGSLTMQFKLVATGTDDFVDDFDHDFTVMDLDHSKAGMMESITISGFAGTPISVITPELAADGSYTFEGLESSKAIPDPRSPWNLTQPQKDASIGFKFSGKHSWEVTYNTYDHTGLLHGGRNFIFTGKTNLQDPKPCGQEGTMDTETGECVIYQDPHIDGFDNPRNGPFLTRISALDMPKVRAEKEGLKSSRSDAPPSIEVDEYERGDFWLVKSAQLSIQGRYDTSEEFRGGRSGLAALAVGGPMLDGGIVTLEPKRGAVTFFGKSLDAVAEHKRETTGGLVAIKTYRDARYRGVKLTLPSGVLVHVRRYNTHLDAKILVPRQFGTIDGQCGNWNGDATDDSLAAINKRMGSTKVLESELLFAKPLNHGKCEDWCSAELFTKIETNKSVIKNLTAWSMKCDWYHCSQCSVCDGISRPSLKEHHIVDATRPSLREHQQTQARCEDWCSSTVFEVQHKNVTSTKNFFWDTKCAWRNCGGCPGCDKRRKVS